jgi:hypothetical protein
VVQITGARQDPLAQVLLLRHLETLGVDVRTGIEVIRLEKNEAGDTTVIARSYPHQKNAPEPRFQPEKVVKAFGLRPIRSIAESLKSYKGIEVYRIGDSVEPREALDAIGEGFKIGNKV